MAYAYHTDHARKEGMVLGIPLGDLGWFQSLFMGVAIGLIGFLASTFVSIASLLIYMIATHHPVDFAVAYKRVGFPVGVGVGALALCFFAFLWVRRVFWRGRRSR